MKKKIVTSLLLAATTVTMIGCGKNEEQNISSNNITVEDTSEKTGQESASNSEDIYTNNVDESNDVALDPRDYEIYYKAEDDFQEVSKSIFGDNAIIGKDTKLIINLDKFNSDLNVTVENSSGVLSRKEEIVYQFGIDYIDETKSASYITSFAPLNNAYRISYEIPKEGATIFGENSKKFQTRYADIAKFIETDDALIKVSYDGPGAFGNELSFLVIPSGHYTREINETYERDSIHPDEYFTISYYLPDTITSLNECEDYIDTILSNLQISSNDTWIHAEDINSIETYSEALNNYLYN